MIEHRFLSGTCPNVTVATGGYIDFVIGYQLPNGRWRVGSYAIPVCDSGYVPNIHQGECKQPGLWIPRIPQCFPANECEYVL